MGLSFLGLNVPTSAAEAGNNLHDNAIAQAQALAARGREAAAIPGNIAGGLQDFFHGLTTGHALGQAAAAQTGPQTTTKAQEKPQAIGGKFVELPGVGRVQMPSEAYLHAHPADASIDMSSPAPAKGSGGAASAKASNPFDELVARYAQANGGTLSLGEMSSLADIATKTSVLRTQPKDPSSKDVAGAELLKLADSVQEQRAKEIAAAADPSKRAQLTESAVKERAQYLQSILGANPVDIQTAGAMGN